MKYRNEILWVLGLLALLGSGLTVRATSEAFYLDWPKSADYEEQFLVETLQGLANRDESRLFVRMFYPGDPTSDEFWRHYLETEKNIHFTRLGCLNEAIRHFAGDGTIKGLVAYPSGNEDLACIAVNVAIQRDLLPVSDKVLADKTEWLSGQTCWAEDTFTANHWLAAETVPLRLTLGGLVLTYGDDSYKAHRPGVAAERWVELDAEARFVEIEVSSNTAPWGLEACDMAGKSSWLVSPTNAIGSIRADLPPSLRGPSKLRIRLEGNKGDQVIVRRVRLLNAQGELTAAQAPVKNGFAGLPIMEDLRKRFASTEEAWQWAIKELLPKASRQMAFSYDNIWQFSGVDMAVAHRAFVFRDDYNKSGDQALKVFGSVAAHVARPGAFFGWAEPEWVYCSRVSEAGHYVVCSIAPNISFFQHVPVAKPVILPKAVSTGKRLLRKFYLIFHVIDGDGFTNAIARYHAQSLLGWDSPQRGLVPICWTIQPLLYKYAPALLEYYARTATPNDGFMSGGSGAGYAYPSLMPDLPQFGLHTQKFLRQANLQSLDLWDLFYYDPQRCHRYLSGPTNRISCYFPAPPSYTQWSARNDWLDDGTAVLSASTRPGMNLWGNYAESLDWRKDPVGDLASRILKASEQVEEPFFIVVHGKMFPNLVKDVMDRLPKDRFEALTMTDTEQLTLEAGRFTAQTEGSGAAPGQQVSVELAVRNPDGKSGKAGEVRPELPAGWKATPAVWQYNGIAPGSTLRQRVQIHIPPDAKPGDNQLVFHKEGDACPRTVRVSVYAGSQVLFDGQTTEIWKSIEQGAIQWREWVAVVSGGSPRDMVSLSVDIDFDRMPLFEIVVPSTRSKWGISLTDGTTEKRLMWGEALIGRQSFDLAEITHWQGRKTVQIRLAPALHGTELELDWIRVHYRK